MKDKSQRELIEEIWIKVMTVQPSVTPKQVLIRRILEVATVAVVLGGVGALIVLLLMGRLTAEDIAKILGAMK